MPVTVSREQQFQRIYFLAFGEKTDNPVMEGFRDGMVTQAMTMYNRERQDFIVNCAEGIKFFCRQQARAEQVVLK